MRLLVSLVLVVCTPVATAAQAPAPAPPLHPSVRLPPALDRVLRDYERGWSAGDVNALAGLFTPDGFALPNGKAPARGADAIKAAYAGGGGPLKLRALAYATADTVGYIIGAFTYNDPAAPDIGKFILALRKGPGGRWLIAADMDNAMK